MADTSKIQWTDATLNIATGCTKVSDGCVNRYITSTPPFRIGHRKFDQPGIGGSTGVVLHPERLGLPLKWRKPRRIFVNSLADLFHEDVPDALIARLFVTMAKTPHHTYQILTKRHARMRSLIGNDLAGPQALLEALHDEADAQTLYDAPWPLPNVWLGVSVEDQKWADIRIPALAETVAAVRFLSCEPLLGALDLRRWLQPTTDACTCAEPDVGDYRMHESHCGMEQSAIDWVIAGGESGPGARATDLAWMRSLVEQGRGASVSTFVKQLGAPWASDTRIDGETVRALGDPKGGDPQWWPADLRVREFPEPAGVVT